MTPNGTKLTGDPRRARSAADGASVLTAGLGTMRPRETSKHAIGSDNTYKEKGDLGKKPKRERKGLQHGDTRVKGTNERN